MVRNRAISLVLLAGLAFAPSLATEAQAQIADVDMREAGLVVGNILFAPGDGVIRYNGLGQFVDRLLTTPDPTTGIVVACCLAFGPDDNLYVSDSVAGQVFRFNGVTGKLMDRFVAQGAGGLTNPLILLFHDGYLYIGDTGKGAIRRYDAQTGAFVDNFLPDNTKGMGAFGDLQHFVFAPDGNLYVASQLSNRILRFNGTTGAFIDEFVPAIGGLDQPSGLTIGPEGRLYVGNAGEVRRYDLNTGEFDVFIPKGGTLLIPVGFNFGPDGKFYTTDVGHASIQKYDGTTGAYLGDLVPSGLGGITGPRTMAWMVKTTVCHVPPGQPGKAKSLTTGYLSARDHLAHGDTFGACK